VDNQAIQRRRVERINGAVDLVAGGGREFVEFDIANVGILDDPRLHVLDFDAGADECELDPFAIPQHGDVHAGSRRAAHFGCQLDLSQAKHLFTIDGSKHIPDFDSGGGSGCAFQNIHHLDAAQFFIVLDDYANAFDSAG